MRGRRSGSFFQLIDQSGGPNACWPWLGLHYPSGYGKYNGSTAHSYVYKKCVGPIPEGMQICHKRECNNKGCVNPAHLYAGTPSQNMQDAVALGWRPTPRFEKNRGRKVPLDVANEIQRLANEGILGVGQGCRTGQISSKDVANALGVSAGTISKIVRHGANYRGHYAK